MSVSAVHDHWNRAKKEAARREAEARGEKLPPRKPSLYQQMKATNIGLQEDLNEVLADNRRPREAAGGSHFDLDFAKP